jgi:hypothetical protein
MTSPLRWQPTYDDAYITLTSAQALWSGTIPNYADTPPLYGVTSPVHVLVVAGLVKVTPPLTALWLSQLIGVALYASGLWVLGRSWRLSRLQSALFLLIGITTGLVPNHLFSGLETGLVLGSVTWSLALAQNRSSMAPIVFGTLPFVRPELAVLGVLLFAWWWWHAVGRDRTQGLILVIAAALPWMLLLAWQLGSVVPSAASAKGHFLAEHCWSSGVKGSLAVMALGAWAWALGPVALGTLGIVRPGVHRVALIGLAIAVIAYAAGLPSHLPRYHHQRYLYGWTPVLLAGGLAVLGWRVKILTVGLPLIAVITFIRVPWALESTETWRTAFLPEQAALVEWLEAHVEPSSTLLVIDAGHLAFSTAHPLVDAVGLKSPTVTALHQRLTGPSCGQERGQALSEIAGAAKADYFISWGEWELNMRLGDQLRAAGWEVELVRMRPPGVIHEWWYPVFRIRPKTSSDTYK